MKGFHLDVDEVALGSSAVVTGRCDCLVSFSTLESNVAVAETVIPGMDTVNVRATVLLVKVFPLHLFTAVVLIFWCFGG